MLAFINAVCWAIATALIVSAGLYFTIRLSFVQFHFKTMLRSVFAHEKKNDGIRSIDTLMMSLAGRIGVGSVAGVALAIYVGGPGSVFWMWVIACIAATNTFAETILGILYKRHDEGSIYKGGPSYYLKYGLSKPGMGSFYAILVLISYIGGFLGIQSNTIVKSCAAITDISPILIGIIIIVTTALIIFGGVRKIAAVTGKIVPVMTLVYVGTALVILIMNVQMIPTIIGSIIADAFQVKPFFSGFIPTIIIGIQRGIFSNEAGLGIGSIAASTTNETDALKQGYIQMIGIYVTTFLICTATAVIILTSPYQNLQFTDMNGIEMTQYAFTHHLGQVGNYIVFISIILFSFSTILTGYYYGESSLKYFFRTIKPWMLVVLKLVTLLLIFIGAVISSTALWSVVDLFVSLLAIINTYALLCLRNQVKDEVKASKK